MTSENQEDTAAWRSFVFLVQAPCEWHGVVVYMQQQATACRKVLFTTADVCFHSKARLAHTHTHTHTAAKKDCHPGCVLLLLK
jgi:hypothetical protein